MYAIAGVSGNTGKVVARTLLEQNKPVRVIVRDASKGAEWKKLGAEVAVAELDDADALGKALSGATGAYLLLPPMMGSTNARADNAKRTAAIVKAIDASGVGHVVFLSSVGAQHDSGTGPIASLHDAEVALGKTKANVTFVRAAYFMENLAATFYALPGGAFPTFLTADHAIAMVASQDIGATAARALVEGGNGHSVIELSGPREYSPSDVGAALGRITGKTIAVQQGPEDALIPALTGSGMNEHWAGLYKEMVHGVNTGRIVFSGPPARAVRGTTDLETLLARIVPKP